MAQPDLVHYLPIATTLISAAFLAVLARRAVPRGWPPHLLWWFIGVLAYGLGTALESAITLFGNSPELNRTWYWAGAILGGYPLATGTVYLLLRRSLAHLLTAASLALVLFASAAVFLTPLDLEALEPHRPTGAVIGWKWVRLLTPIINGYAALFLIGGAFYSSFKALTAARNRHDICRRCSYSLEGLDSETSCPECGADLAAARVHPSDVRSELHRRAIGTAFIAVGGILPGVGGGMAKSGIVEALYIGELAGLVLIWNGYEFCTRKGRPAAQPTQKLASEAS